MALSGSFTLTNEWQVICDPGGLCRVHAPSSGGIMLNDGAFADLPNYETVSYLPPGTSAVFLSYDGLYARTLGEDSLGIYTEAVPSEDDLGKHKGVTKVIGSWVNIRVTAIKINA